MTEGGSSSAEERLRQATCAVLIGDQVSGTAWLLHQEGLLLTAGHVLGKTKPVERMQVRFPEDVPRDAYRIAWGYQHETGVDFAVLKMSQPPTDPLPLPISLDRDPTGPFRLRGYGRSLQDQSCGTGEIIGTFDPQNNSSFRLLQLRTPELAEPGYSGGAVYLDAAQAVVGLQTEAARATTGAGRDTVLAMPLYRIAQFWEPLTAISKGSPLVSVRLVGDSQRDLTGVKGLERPDGGPVFPGRATPPDLRKLGGSGPRRPGSLPRVWNLPARNPAFTGRDELLATVREQLLAGDKAVVRAFQGMGGVGKTQLAAEYAYRFAGSYDLAWWINAEQARLIGDQFAALGAALGCLQPGADTEVVRAEVLGELRERERWLLVFDNARTPADITGWLPGGGGHVLITSRERNWVEIATSVEVDVLARPESAAILQGRVSGLSEVDADRLADELGDLPLAVTQAAGFMAETGDPADHYLDLLRTQPKRLLGSYPTSLAAATQLITDRLDQEDPAAAQLASLSAFLAPEPIPLDWFTNAAHALPELIAACTTDQLAWAQLLRSIGHSSLGRIDEHGLQMHRLTQAILRDGLAADQAPTAREQAGEILAANNPGSADDFATWPAWARLVPHVLAVDPGAPTHGANLRDLACGACWYLLMRGDTRSGYELSRDLRAQWLDRLGADDQDTLRASTRLAAALRMMERYQEASELNEANLARRRRLWGDDDPDTLISAGNLAGDLRGLGKASAALKLNQDNLARRRDALGPDHRNTLGSATCVARDLAASGRVREARELNEDTLARRRRVLGLDHLSTLLSARSLVANLRALGEEQAADDLDRDTRARLQRVANGIDPDRLREHEPEDVCRP